MTTGQNTQEVQLIRTRFCFGQKTDTGSQNVGLMTIGQNTQEVQLIRTHLGLDKTDTGRSERELIDD